MPPESQSHPDEPELIPQPILGCTCMICLSILAYRSMSTHSAARAQVRNIIQRSPPHRDRVAPPGRPDDPAAGLDQEG
jgi:hypothetical protein